MGQQSGLNMMEHKSNVINTNVVNEENIEITNKNEVENLIEEDIREEHFKEEV